MVKQISNNKALILATKNCLISNGIQAMIGMLGMNVHYHEFTDFEHLFENHNHKDRFLILHHPYLNVPKRDHLKFLQSQYKGKIMIIGDEEMGADFHPYILLPNDDEMTVIRKLETFLFSSEPKTDSIQNETLSTREIEILKEVALGYSNKEIADHLFISINTVITHRKNITDKLGIKTIAGLTVYALMNKLIQAQDVSI